ncbi:MAG TPA: thiamine-phosphate kinase [Oscillatoriaceae cyanobacterium]
MPTLAELGEWGLIAALRERYGAANPEFPDAPDFLGIGDDATVGTLTPGSKALTTVDLLIEGVHFRRHTTSPEDLGWKALAVNLSDIAAMGGTPRWAVIGLAAPGDTDADWVLGFYAGLHELARATGTRLAGGDTVGSPGPVMISVTVVGETARPLLRSDARAGDRLFVTGPCGLAAAGLWCMENPDRANSLDREYVNAALDAQRKPKPQLNAARAIAGLGVRVALLDNSDGLARSARLLAEANGLDVRLEQLPLQAATRSIAAQAAIDPRVWALTGGEDYNLVGAIAPADVPALEAALSRIGIPLLQIGALIEGPGRVWMNGPDDQPHELPGDGDFEHFR